jgi:hypothetical protein
MSLDEGTCICLVLGITALTLVYHDLALRAIHISRLPIHTVKIPSTETTTTTCATAPEMGVRDATATQLVPALSAQEQAERIKAQLESQHRDEWCRKYEEQEVARYFREKFVRHEHNRQYDEDTTFRPTYQNGVFGI